MDAGTDAGIDAGVDAGMDAGSDAGMDAGEDGGVFMDGGEADAGVDGGAIDAGPADAGFEGIPCGTDVCLNGDVCCGDFNGSTATFTCAPSCGDAGVVFACDGPEDCDGGTPVCCGTLTTGPGTLPNCPPESAIASCSATCTPNIPLSCDTQAQIVRCHARADCAPYASGNPLNSYTECCTLPQASEAGAFCVTPFIATNIPNISCAP